MANEKLTQSVREWASACPEIDEVWLFGSYFRGDANECSDVDLAVRLGDMSAYGYCESVFAAWSGFKAARYEDLRRRLNIDVDLQLVDNENTIPHIIEYLSGASELIYKLGE